MAQDQSDVPGDTVADASVDAWEPDGFMVDAWMPDVPDTWPVWDAPGDAPWTAIACRDCSMRDCTM